MHCKNSLLFLAIFTFTSCHYQESDPRLVKNQHSLLLTEQDTFELDYLKKFTFGEKTVPGGMLSVSTQTMKNLVFFYSEKQYPEGIIDMALFTDFHGKLEHWIVKKEAVKNLGIYYVENDSIKFDFYDLTNEVV